MRGEPTFPHGPEPTTGMRKVVDIGGGKLHYSVKHSRFSQVFAVDGEVGVMARDTALVFESLAEALRAKELIDAAGKTKYWLTFIDHVEHYDDGAAARLAAGQVDGQPR
jgi:hypothetical protein